MITVISYIAGGGGNHLKNIISLDPLFANSSDMDQSAYDGTRQPPGTVHSVAGRNVTAYMIDRVLAEPDKNWLLHGHWGELMPWRKQLSAANNKWLLITVNDQQDRDLVTTRNQRLGQHPHPYWMDEEQPYLYQPEMYQLYFGANVENIFQLSLVEFWNPDLNHNRVIPRINEFLDINIDPDYAQALHEKWWNLNFSMIFDSTVRDFYLAQTR